MRDSFEVVLARILNRAFEDGLSSVEIKASQLHRSVGGYPGRNHRMPVCCSVMRLRMRPGDQVVYEPAKGTGATLTTNG